MDFIEGYNGTERSLFKRDKRMVLTTSGKNVYANVYIFNLKRAMTPIDSGVWENKRR